MAETMFVLGGSTAAMRAAGLLRSRGIRARAGRAPRMPGLGCGYGVWVVSPEEAERLLLEKGFRILGREEAGGG